MAQQKQRLLYLNHQKQQYADNFMKTTKYNVVNFLPLSIFYQYKRLANCYNLLIAVISLLPGVAPWAPFTWIAPMVFVMLVAVLREGVEDYLRYKQDLKTNSQIVEKIVEEGVVQKITSREITVGDVIKVKEGEELPADIIMIQSSDSGRPQEVSTEDDSAATEYQAICYIQTSSLDGEKALKKRLAPRGMCHHVS